MSDEGASPRYIVAQAERVEADREVAFLRLLSYDPDYAALHGAQLLIPPLPGETADE